MQINSHNYRVSTVSSVH